MMRRLLSSAAMALLAVGLVAFPSVQAQAVDQPAGTLSAVGNLAVQDLRECLSSHPEGALDVYYLIDSSGSLFGASGTDPDKKRAEILQNSLIQLAKLSESFTVQYASGFFGNTFDQPSDWHQVTAEETGQALADEIRAQPNMEWTNWEVAINGAQQALAAKKAETGGCQMLIWLTDGGINISGDKTATASAINTLCGSPVATTGAAPTRGLGQFNELRAANVSVFGTLLSVNNSLTATDKANIPFMQPMVEGTSPTTSTACGEVPVPQSYSNGAYIQATDTTQLSRVFLGLSESIAGGGQGDIDAGGHFQIDPGVAGFSIVSTDGGTWSLTPPKSNKPIVSNDDTSDDIVRVTPSAGALLVSWPTTGKAPGSGQWTFVSSGDPSPMLYRFSGLHVALDPLPRIVAKSPVRIAGTIARDGSEPLDLDNYNFTLTLSKRVAGTAQLTQIATLHADASSGAFSYDYTDQGPEGQYEIIAGITGLTTQATKLPLADLSTSLPITIEIPEQFPTIGKQPVMTELAGSSSVSTGSFTIVGPAKNGATGTACFNEALAPADSPSADRDSTWATSLTVDGKAIAASDCIDVNHGETRTVDVAISNSTPANSTVRATLPVALTPAQGDALIQNVDVRILSTQPVNQGIFWVVLLLLIALGVLIPLALLYAVNYVSAKIGYGAKLQRASFPVTVAPDGTITGRSGVNLRGSEVGTDDFKFLAPKADGRTFTDAELGQLRATLPRNPFGDLIYAIAPAAGRLVFTLGKAGTQSSRLDFRTARKATFNGHMSTLAALTVSQADLVAKGGREPINGTLIVYSKSPGIGQTGYSTRMAEALGASRLRQAMANARETIQAEQAAQQGKAGGNPKSPTPTRAAAPTGTGVPPPAAGGRLDPPAPPPPRTRSSSSPEPPPARRTGTPAPLGRTGGPSTNSGSPPPPPLRRGDEPPPPPPRRN